MKSRSCIPLAVGIVLVVVLTKVWQQVGHPFLEHDDWDFLLPVDAARRDLQFNRLQTEGRWFNYLWWRGPGHLLTPLTAVLLFELSFLVLVVRLAWRWAPGWLCVPTMLALFASPMVASLSYWPATIGPSMLMVAVAACTVTWSAARPRRLAIWIFVFTFLAFLSYPPAALMIFVVLMIELIDRRFRELVLTTLTFGASYAASTVTVLVLNRIAFGTFKIEIRPWRKPNELHDIGDLGENLSRTFHQVTHLVDVTTIPAVLGGLGIGCCLVLPGLRERGVRLLLIAFVALGLQSSTTILTGVVTPYRSNAWVWIVLVVPFVWLARASTSRRWIPVAAVVALVAIGLWGARTWQDDVNHNQHRLDTYDRIVDRLAEVVKEHPDDRVVIYGSASDWLNPDFTQEAQYLSLRALNDHGTRITNCVPPVCSVALRPEVVARADAGARVIRSGPAILVVPSSHQHPYQWPASLGAIGRTSRR